MTIEGIADVQARIAAIQSAFDPAAPTSAASGTNAASGANASSASALASGAATNASFADMLSALQAGNTASGVDGTDTSGSSSALGDLSSLPGLGGQSALGSLGGLGGLGSSGTIDSLTGLTGAGATPGLGSANALSFVNTALAEAGKKYVYGAVASPSDPNPSAFDCSELVQWAAARNGVSVPRTAGQQYATLAAQGDSISVDQALRTPGALLFEFSSTPRVGGAEPAHAHVAISLGDGRTIEARGRAYGVGVFQAGSRFQYAAVIPGLS